MALLNRRYSQHARRALVHARLIAQKHQHSTLDTAHLLLGIWLTEGSSGQLVLQELKTSWPEGERYLAGLFPRLDAPIPNPISSDALETALLLAKDEAYWLGHHYIGTEHMLLALARSGGGQVPELLRFLNISSDQIRRRVRRLLNENMLEINQEAARRLARLSELSRRVLNAANQLAEDYGHPAAGVEHVLLVLARERRSPVARLLTEAGLNQEALAADLVHLKADEESLSAALDDVLDSAVDRAEALGSHYTGTDHILLAMTLQSSDLLDYYKVDIPTLQTKIRAGWR